MANRRLRRFLRDDEDLAARLDKHHILTPQQLLQRSELDLVQLLDLPLFRVRELLATVCQAISPAPSSVRELS